MRRPRSSRCWPITTPDEARFPGAHLREADTSIDDNPFYIRDYEQCVLVLALCASLR